jgi:hypothetical protein
MLKFLFGMFGYPKASAVMARAIILKYQIVKGMATPPSEMLASWMKSWSAEDQSKFLEEAREKYAQLEKSLRESGLWTHMSESEHKFILASITEVTDQMRVNASWLMESAECMLWALGYVDQLPAYDTEANVDHLNCWGSSTIADLLRNAKLRPTLSILEARDIAELWHWRSRTRQLQEEDRPVNLPNGQTLTDIVKLAAEKAASDGLFASPVKSDFPVNGRSYAEISSDEWSRVRSIAMERHKSLNWLCGHAPRNNWEETPTDT